MSIYINLCCFNIIQCVQKVAVHLLTFIRRTHPILLIPHPTNAPYGCAAAIYMLRTVMYRLRIIAPHGIST